MSQPPSMDRSMGPRLVVLLVVIALCAATSVLGGCKAPHEREVVHPTAPEVEASQPDKPSPVEIVSTRTPRGIEVLAPRYLVERSDLFLLALREIDSAGMHNLLGGWRVRLVAPTDPEGHDQADQLLRVRWRAADHEPTHVMLPSLQSVVDAAVTAKFGG